MILRRYIKSWKGFTILILVCLVVFMGLIIDTQVRTQMLTNAENEQLKAYKLEIDAWKKCFEDTSVFTVDSEKVVKLADIQKCGR